jgi:hypothetical protein
MTFSDDLQSAIDFVSEVMPEDSDWWIIGSTAVALLGLEVTVADVDVVASSDVITDVLKQIGVEPLPPKADSRFRSTPFARAERLGMLPVEFMGGLEVNGKDGWQPLVIASRQAVRAGTATVYIPSPDEQIAIFHRFGRDKDLVRAELVTRFTAG